MEIIASSRNRQKSIAIAQESIISHSGMKLARGPQTEFLSNYCSGIPELANYEMPNEVCEGNFGGTFFRHRDSRSARNGCHGAAGRQAPRLRHLTTSNPGIQAIGSWA